MGEIIRKTKGGKFVGWYLRFVDADGRRKQRASKQPSHAEARRMLVEIEARIARGRVGMEARRPPQTLTVEETFDRFIDEYRNPKVKDGEAYRRRAKILLGRVRKEAPQVVRSPLGSLTSGLLGKTRDALMQRYPPGTVRTTMTTLSAALSWAVREELIEKNPAIGVPRPTPPAPRLDFFSAAEVRRLLDEVERRARTGTGQKGLLFWSRFVGISLAVRLGLRKGEVFGLRWQDVDLDRQQLTVARSYATTPKNGKARHLRLPAALIPLLGEWRARCPATPVVCPILDRGGWRMSRNATAEHGLSALLRAAGCRVFNRPWHMLRHTFASHFMQSGGGLLALSQILGHSDVRTTTIYAHLSSDFLADQLDRVKF